MPRFHRNPVVPLEARRRAPLPILSSSNESIQWDTTLATSARMIYFLERTQIKIQPIVYYYHPVQSHFTVLTLKNIQLFITIIPYYHVFVSSGIKQFSPLYLSYLNLTCSFYIVFSRKVEIIVVVYVELEHLNPVQTGQLNPLFHTFTDTVNRVGWYWLVDAQFLLFS